MTTSDVKEDGEPTRRDFIHIFGAVTAAAGAGAVLWPLVSQMNPDASVLALSTKEVDLSTVPVGQAIKIMWQGKPVFIRHRTEEEINEATNTPLTALKDPVARNENLSGKNDAGDDLDDQHNRQNGTEGPPVIEVLRGRKLHEIGTEAHDRQALVQPFFDARRGLVCGSVAHCFSLS